MCSNFIALAKHIPELEVAHAVADLGDSEELYEKIFRLVLRLIPQNIEQMDETLYVQNDLGAFAIKVHGTKGSLRQLGHKNLSECAGLLEDAAKAGDRQYCLNHYGEFKTQVLLFCNEINTALAEFCPQGGEEKNQSRPIDDIRDFLDVLAQAKEAIDDFDCIAALDILSLLNDRHFEAKADRLLAATIAELEIFNLQKAAECLLALQEEYCEE